MKKLSYYLTFVFVLLFAVQASAATLDELNSKKDQLADELQKAQSASQDKSQEIKSLSVQINSLESDIKATESKIGETSGQITQTQREINNLSGQIKIKTEELNDLKQKINASIVEIYRFSSRSSWELIFSVDNLSETSNQVKYTEAIQMQVKSMYNKHFTIKEELDKQKTDEEAKKEELDNLKLRQEEYKKGSEYEMYQKDKLLGLSADQKKQYEQNAQNAMQQLSTINAEIRNRIEAGAGSNTQRGGTGGYPFSDVEPFSPNTCLPNYATSFCKRNCTDYAAWKWSAMGYPASKLYGAHDASNWANHAIANGLETGSEPREGALITWNLGRYGHVAYVEEVYADSTFKVSEYNFSPAFGGEYSTDVISVNSRSSMGVPTFIYP